MKNTLRGIKIKLLSFAILLLIVLPIVNQNVFAQSNPFLTPETLRPSPDFNAPAPAFCGTGLKNGPNGGCVPISDTSASGKSTYDLTPSCDDGFYIDPLNPDQCISTMGSVSAEQNQSSFLSVSSMEGGYIPNACSMRYIKTFKGLVSTIINCLLNPIVGLIVSLSILSFIWGIFKFIRSAGDDKQEGRELMFWGVVGIFVMVSVWGLVNILRNTFTLRL